MRYYRFLQENPSEWVDFRRTDYFEMTDEHGNNWCYFPLSSHSEAETMATTYRFSQFEVVELNQYVDWGVQWSLHSPDYKDYSLEIDLCKYTTLPQKAPILYLNAGPGFGDLSHPTTRLTLTMMAPYVQGSDVIDIGCGSGILSLAAILLGAKSAIGLDIDEEALEHANQNTKRNQLENQVIFQKSENFVLFPSQKRLILMNMITSQQKEAWASLPQLHTLPAHLFTSGVLASERDHYLKYQAQKGWSLLEERIEGDWMAFHWETGYSS